MPLRTHHQPAKQKPAWAQGFPLTTPLDKFDGPELPASVDVTWQDRFYPKAWGHPKLRQAICDYYNSQVGVDTEEERSDGRVQAAAAFRSGREDHPCDVMCGGYDVMCGGCDVMWGDLG